MPQPAADRGARPRHARPDAALPGEARSTELRSFDALWSDGHWEHRPDPDSLRSWLGLSPTATLTDLPPIREEFLPPPAREREPEPERRPVYRYPGLPPRPRGRAYFTVAFWVLLAASLMLWWLDTPARSLGTTGDVLLAVGRITGIAGGFVLLFQVLLMSRAAWLERWIGAHSIMVWHRELGGYLFFAIVTHAVTTLVAYSDLGERPFLAEAWDIVTGWPDMLNATLAALLLIGVTVVSIRGVRRTMSYETWYYLHLSAYLIVVLGYAHQFSTGEQLSDGLGWWFWTGLHVFVIANLAWGRIIGPVVLNVRHRLRVVDVVEEAPGMVSLYIGGRRLPGLKVRAGQYFRWRFLTRDAWWQAHPFSLSAAPNHEWLRLTVKMVGDHTRALQHLRPGTRVVAEGPSGVFTADRSVKRSALLIAGGSGIAPIRALLEDLPPGTILIYRATSPADIVFRRELDWLAHERRAYVWYVIGRRDDPAPRQLFTPRGLHKLIPDVAERDVFLCGPPGLVAESVRTLRRLRVRRRQIHVDPFEF
jgi:predicted ferric reductase